MLKVGVLGVSNLGKIHLDNWKEIEQTEITGFYELDDYVAEDARMQYPITRFSDVDELINACDAIDITAPFYGYFGSCEKAIRKGRHIFIEKTLAHSIEQAKQLIKLIRESNITFQVGFDDRFNPAFTALQTLSPRPLIIEGQNILSLKHKGLTQQSIYDLIASDIDIILSEVKSDVKSIHVTSARILHDPYDLISARIEFNNGCVANMTWGRLSPIRIHRIRIYELGRFIDIDFINTQTTIINSENMYELEKDQSLELPAGTGSHIHAGERGISSVKRQLEQFRNAIVNNTPPVVSAIDGLRAMDIAHQILHKIKPGY